jgi:DNA-binding NarL/FixJ family response regulator
MNRFSITEARARFCYHPKVRHTLMSERRAGELIRLAAYEEGKRPGLPKNRDEDIGPQTRVRQDEVLAMMDVGLGVDDVAVKLGVSPETVRDRMRLWRPMREKRPAQHRGLK